MEKRLEPTGRSRKTQGRIKNAKREASKEKREEGAHLQNGGDSHRLKCLLEARFSLSTHAGRFWDRLEYRSPPKKKRQKVRRERGRRPRGGGGGLREKGARGRATEHGFQSILPGCGKSEKKKHVCTRGPSRDGRGEHGDKGRTTCSAAGWVKTRKNNNWLRKKKISEKEDHGPALHTQKAASRLNRKKKKNGRRGERENLLTRKDCTGHAVADSLKLPRENKTPNWAKGAVPNRRKRGTPTLDERGGPPQTHRGGAHGFYENMTRKITSMRGTSKMEGVRRSSLRDHGN